jgi:hypothetical protein
MIFIHTPLQSGFFTSSHFLVFGMLLLGLFSEYVKNHFNQELSDKNATQNPAIKLTKNTIGQVSQNPLQEEVLVAATEETFSNKSKIKIKFFYDTWKKFSSIEKACSNPKSFTRSKSFWEMKIFTNQLGSLYKQYRFFGKLHN